MAIKEKILFAGFGGQGILAAGKIFAEACIENNLNASWMPSYGPEMRGGTCNCQVVISDGKILSPMFTRPTHAVIMNQASFDKFLDKLDKSKMIVVNTSLVKISGEAEEKLKNLKIVKVPATDIALEIGFVQCANMVVLGAYAKYCTSISIDLMKESIKNKFKSKPEALDINLKAMSEGYEIAK
ncbi:2-oxoacid:acceptor oxidoreductase family protein [Sedimentibacter hydroxybenzoicus DSM 7310]|uniref:2-oxoacid:acceptor oxidoreductase family protein n=1 Tax=Sedimentibacter hydroxybenzoicus DSM 7310 TaxID=1123245 RepID=A0A974BKH2_SEDHY|nr:2-oxoacid:acceptor oxidoreductase family protein [Sedimentibacter hydroxybenzoicus]NYB74683.1 2-oxoacid:acceptor oxidoreductase family protein [Sedimentibacter hydroxybenzoicus DSM 7310]